MTTEQRVRVGIIAETARQRSVLQATLSAAGYEVVMNTGPEHLSAELLASPAVVAWVAELPMDPERADVLDLLAERAVAPVLFGDGETPDPADDEYPRWRRRLVEKLGVLSGSAQPEPAPASLPPRDRVCEQAETARPAQPRAPSGPVPGQVWVLAASLGGPPAVKLFLDSLPAGLDVAFIYAQHIEAGFQGTLSRVLGRHSHYDFLLAEHDGRLERGRVLMMPVEHEFGFMAGGTVCNLRRPWSGPYNPCIDQVVTNVANCFGKIAGVIVFSGMGEDGSEGARELAARGGQVWVQEFASCACSSMPEATAAAVRPGYIGTPEQLARHLAARSGKTGVGR